MRETPARFTTRYQHYWSAPRTPHASPPCICTLAGHSVSAPLRAKSVRGSDGGRSSSSCALGVASISRLSDLICLGVLHVYPDRPRFFVAVVAPEGRAGPADGTLSLYFRVRVRVTTR